MLALPGFTETKDIKLDQTQEIQGTYQGTHMGQVLFRTADGLDLELPSMTLFWHAHPPVSQSQLEVGQEVTVHLPEDLILRVVNGEPNPMVLGNYEGIYKVPSEQVATWKVQDSASR